MNTLALASLTAAATTQAGIAVATLAIALLGLLAAASLARGARQETRRTAMELATAAGRLDLAEARLAEAATELAQLRQRLDQALAQRPVTGSGSAGFRQAIALSRHGATTRQLIDTCGLSQGEAHLIQSLYGRTEPGTAGDLH
jgi:hypothetical protein